MVGKDERYSVVLDHVISSNARLKTYRREPLVYFLLNNGVVAYVGQTYTLGARLKAHEKDKIFNDVKYIVCSGGDLNYVESLFIRAFRPIYNAVIHGPIISQKDIEEIKTLGFRGHEDNPGTKIEFGTVVLLNGENEGEIGYYDDDCVVYLDSEVAEYYDEWGVDIPGDGLEVAIVYFGENFEEIPYHWIKPDFRRCCG